MQTAKNLLKVGNSILWRVFNSRRFTLLIILLFVIQALWIALSFTYPMIYDERFHFDIIQIYTNHHWPIIYNQPESYDVARDFSGEGSKLFHFLSSYIQRLLSITSLALPHQIIIHRLINISIVALGMYYFSILFDRLKINRGITNTALLILILLPVFTFMAATINYDNLLFLIVPLYFMSYLSLVDKSSHPTYQKILGFLTLGIIGSLVKFTFLAIFAALSLVLIIKVLKRYKITEIIKGKSFWDGKFLTKLSLSLVFILISALFIQTYVVNLVKYQTPRPTCQQTLSKERCMDNSIIQRNEKLLSIRNKAETVTLQDYTYKWLDFYNRGLYRTGANTVNAGGRVTRYTPLITRNILFFISIASVAVLIYAWKGMRLHKELKAISAVGLLYLVLMYMQNVQLYYKYADYVALNTKYLIIFLPVLLVLIVMAYRSITISHTYLRLPILIIVLGILLQGGGVLTHITKSSNNWYWKNETVIETNEKLRRSLDPIIVD